MKKYEYMVRFYLEPLNEKEINNLTSGRWRLVNILEHKFEKYGLSVVQFCYYFEREYV